MEVLSMNEVKPSDHKQQSENTENIMLICFDPNNELNDNTDNFNIQLHLMTNLHQIDSVFIFCSRKYQCFSFENN